MERDIDPSAASGGLRGVIRRTRDDPTLRREADMMGFYVAVALMAALSAGSSDHAEHTQLEVLGIVWGTTVGLAIAHWFAMLLSLRVVHDPDLHHTPSEMLVSQLVMAVGVAIAASLVVAALSDDLERLGARVTAAAFIAGLVGFEARTNGASPQRAATYGVGALFDRARHREPEVGSEQVTTGVAWRLRAVGCGSPAGADGRRTGVRRSSPGWCRGDRGGSSTAT